MTAERKGSERYATLPAPDLCQSRCPTSGRGSSWRRTDPRLFVPVVLTLLTPEEMGHPPSNKAELKRLKMRQLERITAEAWRQDGVLTTMDPEWILHLSPGLIRELLEAYQERFGMLLPTAGTVLDMGRTLTHKTIVVELALQGLSTTEIARRI